MDMPIGVDDSGHLKGMYSFIQNRRLEPGSLAAAAFWVGLRQDIYSAVRKGEQVRMNLVCGLADRSLGAADDYTWANRAIVHCADVLNFCFGPDRHRIARWHELNSWNDGWGSGRPSSFDPFFRQDQDSAPFPEVWYHGSYQGRSHPRPRWPLRIWGEKKNADWKQRGHHGRRQQSLVFNTISWRSCSCWITASRPGATRQTRRVTK